nr:putative ribonuclease H-like domain-containing protein [Tanacetum cinerariifolium]
MEPKKPVQPLKDPSWAEAMQDELLQFKLLNVWTLVVLPKDKWAIVTKWVFRNKKDERGIVIKNKARLVAQGHTQREGIDYDEVFALVARIEAIRLFLAYASFKDFVVYQMDVKSASLYGKIEEEVYVCQPPGFEDPNFPDKVYKVEKALYGLHQAPRACQDKYVVDILKKFDFSTVKTTSTPMDPNKTLVKDAKAEDVDVRLYRSMIGSFMYLTAFKPDIAFSVCTCARFQVTLKTSHLHVVKIIFRYLKGQPKLGLCYPRDSPFDLEAYSNSDYAEASLNRKSTIGSCQFLGKRMERAATTASSLEAEQDSGNINRTQSMATLNEPLPQGIGSGSGPWRQLTILGGAEAQTSKSGKVNDQEYIQALVDKQKVIIKKESIRSDLKFNDAKGTACLPNDTIFEELARMGAKTTAWSEFSSIMASAIICLANNQNFNFFKYIFDRMVKHLEGGVKFLMFPRFMQVFLNKQVKGMAKHKKIYVISSHTKKIFANMRRQRQGSFGNVTPLFETIMVHAQEEVGGVRFLLESILTPSNDLLPSGEDSIQLNELIIFCTNLQQQVLDLEEAKIAQAKEIAKLKKIDKKLEKRRKSKPGRSIEYIDQDAEIALVDKSQERMHDADMFGVNDLEVTAASVEYSAAPTTAIITDVDDELTLEKTLIVIKASKPKMIEPEKPLKKKDQIALDEEVERNLEAKMRAKMEEEERIAREKDEAIRAVIEEWDDI